MKKSAKLHIGKKSAKKGAYISLQFLLIFRDEWAGGEGEEWGVPA